MSDGADIGSADPDRLQASVAIVGGGASGTLAALHLLRTSSDPGLRIALFEADPCRGHLGVAYGTTDPRHLLNLRAQVMSAFPDEPDHFADWARCAGRGWTPTDFLPRMVYGDYLRDLVSQFGGHRLSIVGARVKDIASRQGGFEISTDCATAPAESVVLAYGVSAPHRLATAAGPVRDASWHLQSPWDLEALARVPDDATVVLAGSGLTAIDAAITLLEDASQRRVVMVSRRGELPRAHLEQVLPDWRTPIPTGPLTTDGIADLVYDQIAAAHNRGVDWRAVLDGMRPQSQSIWRRLDQSQRRRFLTTYEHTWHVHRNRMAPQIAARISAYRDTGRLTLHAGGLRTVDDLGTRCRVHLADTTFEADALINCTGPLSDVTKTTNPLLRALLDRGSITPDPLGLGVACTESGELLDSRGDVVPGMYALGPPTRGTAWEAISVPEIRNQAARLATHLTGTTAVSRTAMPVTGQ
ncbi:FAD/NAD(P)-binding protein [Pseudonocardia alaniniphila]|uniref:FAD/NAD(P)-binding protein n=1 Tax=Pseudonocardia alaniniphila TaxID=75291 RepID=A0ABS9TU58_9PSEU|nr:FAD/NAD(P)-binding protein [Pseudonocardia alaniniphila]MCH6171756.1 FAD/NAD(P)-binding protein [Pseudonocardia alaniniphila]